MKKRDFHYKGVRILVFIVVVLIIAGGIFSIISFAMHKPIGLDLINKKSKDAYNSELFSDYDGKVVVFSLYESPLLQYASDLWNSSHTSEVVCVTAEELWGKEDWNYNEVKRQIENSINQGRGPDLMVIDYLGYLESDLLVTSSPTLFQDIAYICEQDNIYSNIAHMYNNKGKTYAIPLRIVAPAVGGRDVETVNSARTLNTLATNVLEKDSLNGIELYQKKLSDANIPQSEVVFNYAEALPELFYPIWRNYIKENRAMAKDKCLKFANCKCKLDTRTVEI